MVHIRGTSVLGTVRFVRETYGSEAHETVLAALPARHCATFLGPVREASWEPLEDLVAYMEMARTVLAPDEDGFYRRIGRYVGRQVGGSGFRFLMGSHPHAAVTRAAFMWGFLYDAGRVEIVSKSEREIVFQIRDFTPPSRTHCERIAGFLEGCLDVQGADRPRVEEMACALAGADHCQIRVQWGLPDDPTP